jgi:hypothetical protein
MARMKRKEVLTAIRAAGYHGNKERAMLLYIKNWVSFRVYGHEFEAGVAMRENGVPCDCFECKKGEPHAPRQAFRLECASRSQL